MHKNQRSFYLVRVEPTITKNEEKFVGRVRPRIHKYRYLYFATISDTMHS